MQRLAPLRDVLQLSAETTGDARLPEVLSATADACRDIALTVSQVAMRDLGGASVASLKERSHEILLKSHARQQQSYAHLGCRHGSRSRRAEQRTGQAEEAGCCSGESVTKPRRTGS